MPIRNLSRPGKTTYDSSHVTYLKRIRDIHQARGRLSPKYLLNLVESHDGYSQSQTKQAQSRGSSSMPSQDLDLRRETPALLLLVGSHIVTIPVLQLRGAGRHLPSSGNTTPGHF